MEKYEYINSVNSNNVECVSCKYQKKHNLTKQKSNTGIIKIMRSRTLGSSPLVTAQNFTY